MLCVVVWQRYKKNIVASCTEMEILGIFVPFFGGQISRSFKFMEAAVKKELSDIEGLDIRTVSDFSNAAFKGLVEMLKAD